MDQIFEETILKTVVSPFSNLPHEKILTSLRRLLDSRADEKVKTKNLLKSTEINLAFSTSMKR